MLRANLRTGKPRFAVLVLPLILTLAYWASRPRFYDGVPRRNSGNEMQSEWWVEFFTRLHDTRVTAHATKVRGRLPLDNWKPDTNSARPELLRLSEDDQVKFRASHASFIRQLSPFASHLPYNSGTTGIVTTAGVHNFGQAISMVLATRQAGSRLPIQIVLDSSSPWIDWLCVHTIPRFNVTCLFLEDMWAGTHRLVYVPKFKGFQWKSISIIASTFQNVLFLDADCLPVLNPDPIFSQGSEPFTSTGFISWPDFWTQAASAVFYKIAGGPEVPLLTSRPSSESGMMVFDKARHADTLLLAAYYNYNGPSHYYPMLTQHGPGEGDRETFFQAALVLDALRRQGAYVQTTGIGVKKGYWDVKMLPAVHGRTAKGEWTGMFMLQMDPMEDYHAVIAAVKKAKKEGAIAKEDFLTDSTFLAPVGNLTLEHNPSRRVMFFHHNGPEPDFTRIVDSKSRLVATNEEHGYLRMWGDPGWIIDRFGRDVEKLLWQDSMQIYCQAELAQFQRLRRVCAKLREIHKQVYT